MSSRSTPPQRWRLITEDNAWVGERGRPDPDEFPEGIEVMPVSEHVAIWEDAQAIWKVINADHERLREAAQAVVDEFGWSESCGSGLLIGALRTALDQTP